MSDVARGILAALQAAVDARDATALAELFDDGAVLIGTAGDARDRDALLAYATAVVESEPFRWEWDTVVPIHESGDMLGFVAFGAIESGGERVSGFRLTALAVRTHAGWKLRSFHGSFPSSF